MLSRGMKRTLEMMVILLACEVTAYSQSYSVIDIGGLPGAVRHFGVGINESGQVVGLSKWEVGQHLFYWDSENGVIDIGDLPGGKNLSGGLGINNLGQAPGWSETQGGVRHAFVWDIQNGMRDIGMMFPGSSYGNGINDYGIVAGHYQSNRTSRSFLWDADNGVTHLEQLYGSNFSVAFDVNCHNQVVGYARVSTGYHACLWDADHHIHDLGDLPGGNDNSYGYRLNDRGQVTGQSDSSAGPHAFLWDMENGMQDIGGLTGAIKSYGFGINNLGQVVGWSETAQGDRAFLWDNENGMRNLNNLLNESGAGWVILQARDINDSGWITGGGINPDGNIHTCLLMPESLTLSAPLDILPGSDRNPFMPNKKGKGRIPMAILGSDEVAVEDIDPASIKIAGTTSPIKTSTDKDVDGDGFVDLVMHFSRRALIDALSLDTYEVGSVVEITVEAVRVEDGRPIEATDSIVIVGSKN